MTPPATTWQTIGPFFSIGMSRMYRDTLAGPGVAGERVEITGRIFDGDGEPVPDGIVEIWQANSHGKYAHPDDEQDKPLDPGFTGYGRVPTDEEGRFGFTTIKPGRVPAGHAAFPPRAEATGRGDSASPSALQAPHLAISVFTRGLLRRLITRMYFPDEPSNAEDFALNLVDPSRRATLIAKKVEGRSGALEWDIVLQGPNETVFFDI
jgi:protocatechuate 3,4-dioxygenase, alpha subunit